MNVEDKGNGNSKETPQFNMQQQMPYLKKNIDIKKDQQRRPQTAIVEKKNEGMKDKRKTT